MSIENNQDSPEEFITIVLTPKKSETTSTSISSCNTSGGSNGNPTHVKSSSTVDLKDYIEVSNKYVKLLKNTWLKYKDKISGNLYNGGTMIEETTDTITLRNIQQHVTVLEKNKTIFYCKKTNPIYEVIKELMIERQKLHIERVRLAHLEKQLKNK